jgi:tRNA (mo5U34)-methyltransferase
MDLGGGLVTPGRDHTPRKLSRLGLPERLDGLTVLDVGAWDGFFSFEAERRGAARVLATDSWAWREVGWGTKAGFELARRTLGSRVEDLEIDVMDLSPERVGRFDLVLCLGVLYHLRHPLRGLERVASVTGGTLLLETHVETLGLRRPMSVFYPGDELDGDAANWWGPNIPAVQALLGAAGFRDVRLHWPRSPVRRGAQVAKRLPGAVAARLREGIPVLPRATEARAVFHARGPG